MKLIKAEFKKSLIEAASYYPDYIVGLLTDILSKNEKVNSTHLSPSRFYFCTVDIFSFTPLMVCLNSF